MTINCDGTEWQIRRSPREAYALSAAGSVWLSRDGLDTYGEGRPPLDIITALVDVWRAPEILTSEDHGGRDEP